MRRGIGIMMDHITDDLNYEMHCLNNELESLIIELEKAYYQPSDSSKRKISFISSSACKISDLEKFSNDKSIFVCMAVASHPKCPEYILVKLLNDSEVGKFVARSPKCSSNIFKKLLVKRSQGYGVLNKNYLIYLNRLNLANVSFNGIKINGIDFSGTNARIDLQKVYNKNASNCIINDNNLLYDFCDLDGVNICGSTINSSNILNVEKSIYDDNTIIDNQSVADMLNKRSL